MAVSASPFPPRRVATAHGGGPQNLKGEEEKLSSLLANPTTVQIQLVGTLALSCARQFSLLVKSRINRAGSDR